ncbi:MAG: site-specific integrase [Dysosmobacter sp.]
MKSIPPGTPSVPTIRDTTQFAEYLHNYCDIDLREADSAAVQDYMDWMLSHGKSAASVTRFLASVKSFYSYCWLPRAP